MDALKKKIQYVYPHIFPVLLFVSLEIQNKTNIYSNLPALFISCFLLYISFWILLSIFGRIFVSGVFASLVLLAFYTVNFYRQMQTGQILLPYDLNLARHIGSIFAFSNITLHWRPICSILCTIALHIPLFHVSRQIRFSPGNRAVIFVVAGTFMYFSFFSQFSYSGIQSSLITDASASTTTASYNDIYRDQGALLGFYTIGAAGDAEEPQWYSRAYMESLMAKVAQNHKEKNIGADILNGANIPRGANKPPDTKPNVIVVMSESYWDPTRLPAIVFSEDPVPNLHRLNALTTSGNVIPPVFGGMTCNTEFEFLTGNAMKFVGYGDIPYYEEKTYIDRDNGRSLVSMFKANGYQTVALHTYSSTFFNRDVVYPKLGFDTFIAEEALPGAKIKGSLRGQDIISDEYFADILIDILENGATASEADKSNIDSDSPLFIFGITMQNHTPYLPDKYESTHIKAYGGGLSGLLSDEDIEYIETYLEGVYDADMVLGRLYDYVMETDAPTILLYFGDHLPLLTQHTGIYTDLGYIGEGELNNLPVDEAYKMHSTPYIAVSNYIDMPPTWGSISPYFMGAVLAEAAGIEMNLYYQFLLQTYYRVSAMNEYFYVVDENIYSAPGEDINDAIEMFAAFQYDKLFGEDWGQRDDEQQLFMLK